MSHFTVLVTGDEYEDAEAMLAQFQENNMGDCPAEYLEFEDETKEVQDGYVNGTIGVIRAPDGSIYSRSDKMFQQKIGNTRNSFHQVYPEGYEEVDIPNREYFDTEAEYAWDCHGLKWNEEHEGYGYLHNPNTQWDWYSLGGRWTGALRLKPEVVIAREADALPAGQEVADGRPGIMTAPNTRIERADTCLVSQLDIEWHKEDARRAAGETWDAWNNPDRPANPGRDGWGRLSEKERQEIMDYERKHGLFFLTQDDQDRLESNTREAYLELFGAPKAITYAFIDLEGKWNERAHMGWFGVTWDENTDFDVEFWRWIESLPDDTRVWCFDCHI